jgi:hypothetical protein
MVYIFIWKINAHILKTMMASSLQSTIVYIIIMYEAWNEMNEWPPQREWDDEWDDQP